MPIPSLVAFLDRLRHGRTLPTIAAAPPRQRRRWLLLTALALGVVLTPLVLWLLKKDSPPAANSGAPKKDSVLNRPLEGGGIGPEHKSKLEPPRPLGPLSFGAQITVRFDPRFLDDLDPEIIPPEDRFPWQPKELVAVLGEHRLRGNVLAISPDGKHLAVASPSEPFIFLGNPDTIHLRTALAQHPGGVTALAFSPDGTTLASCGPDKVVRLWEVQTGKERHALQGHSSAVRCLAFAPDGKHLLAGEYAALWLWDVESGKPLKTLKGPPGEGLSGEVSAVAFSPRYPTDPRALSAGSSGDGTVRLWDLAKGTELRKTSFRASKLDDTTFVSSIAFSPDGRHAVSGHSDRVLRLWDVDAWKFRTLGEHQGNNLLVTYSPKGDHILSASNGEPMGVRLWDPATGKHERTFGERNGATALAYYPDGGRIAFANHDISLHDVATGKEIHPARGHTRGVGCVALAPEGRFVASGGQDSTLRLWDLRSGKERYSLPGDSPVMVGFTPDGRRGFQTGPAAWAVQLFDVDTGKPWGPKMPGHTHWVTSAAISPDGRYVLSGAHDYSMRLFDLTSGKEMRRFLLRRAPNVYFAPDGRRALSSGATTQLWDLATEAKLHEWPQPNALFTPAGRVAFLGGAAVPLWDVSGTKPEQRDAIHVNTDGATSVVFTRDGRRLAQARDGASVWEVETGTRVWQWRPPPFLGVSAVALSPDGRHLITANSNGTLYVIRLAPR